MSARHQPSPKTKQQGPFKTWPEQSTEFRYTDFMSQHLFAIILISLFMSVPRAFGADESGSAVKINPDGLVDVDPSYVETTRTSSGYELVPFKQRRGKWGQQVSIGYSSYIPSYYASEFVAYDYKTAYGDQADLPLIEAQYTFKRNFSFGSVGLEAGAGIFQNSSALANSDRTLQLIPVRLGVTVILDGIFSKPYIAPYGSVGAYTMIFKETQVGQDNEYGGNTQAAPYYTLGLQLNLDWLDPVASRQGFEESGIQATFVYVEARQFLESSAARDRDFSNDIEPNAGIRVEF